MAQRVTIKHTPLSAVQAARADAIITALANLWPGGFAVYQRRRKPLAIGIDRVLIAQLEPAISAGHITETDVRLALQRYTSADCYLQNTIVGRARVGLDGKPVGVVSEKHAQRARDILAKRKARRELNRYSTLTVERRSRAGLGTDAAEGEMSSRTAPLSLA